MPIRPAAAVLASLVLATGCGPGPELLEDEQGSAGSTLLSASLAFGDGTTAPKVTTIPGDTDRILLRLAGSNLPVDETGVSLVGLPAPFRVVREQATPGQLTLRVYLFSVPENGATEATYTFRARTGAYRSNPLTLTVRRDFDLGTFSFGDGSTGLKTRALPSATGVRFKVQGRQLPFDQPGAYELLGAPAAASLDPAASSSSQLVFNLPLGSAAAGRYGVSTRIYNRVTPQLTLDLVGAARTTNCTPRAFLDNNRFLVRAVQGRTIAADVAFSSCGRKGELRRQGVGGLREFVGDVVSLSGDQVTFDPGTLPAPSLPLVGEELYLLWF